MTKEQIRELTLRITQSNHSGLALVLLEMEEVYIKDALESFNKDKELDKFNNEVVLSQESEYYKNLEQAKKVHSELMDMINPTDKSGKQVWKMLVDTNECIIKSVIKKKPYYLEQYVIFNKFLKEIFENLHKTDTDPPVMKNVHQVFAGLTYGKGKLNENIDEGKNINRGFLI